MTCGSLLQYVTDGENRLAVKHPSTLVYYCIGFLIARCCVSSFVTFFWIIHVVITPIPKSALGHSWEKKNLYGKAVLWDRHRGGRSTFFRWFFIPLCINNRDFRHLSKCELNQTADLLWCVFLFCKLCLLICVLQSVDSLSSFSFLDLYFLGETKLFLLDPFLSKHLFYFIFYFIVERRA